MSDRQISLVAKWLDRYNVADFDFLVTPGAISDMQRRDGTVGFAVMRNMTYVGALCGKFVSRAEFLITSIYVSKKYRYMGVGSFMLDTLLEMLENYNATVSVKVPKTGRESDALGDFLIEMGFEETYSERSRVYVTDLATAGLLKLPGKAAKLVLKPFSLIPDDVIEAFFEEETNAFRPLPVGGIHDEDIDRDVSIAIVEGGKIRGYAIVEAYDDSDISLSCIYVEEDESNIVLMSLITEVRDAVCLKYDVTTKLYIPVVNEKIAELIEEMIPARKLDKGMTEYRLKLPFAYYDYSAISLSDFLKSEGMDMSDTFYAAS